MEERVFSPSFVGLSRSFVCVRFDSYENDETMDAIRELLNGRLANTACTVLAPDGKSRLSGSGRSLHQLFGDRFIEAELARIAKQYPGRNMDELPLTPDFTAVRESVNMSACDGRPLVIAWASSETERAAMEKQLRPLAWSEEFIGRVHWDMTVGDSFRSLIPNSLAGESGVIVVQPEPYGRTATVIGAIDLDLSLEDQQWVLRRAVERFEEQFEKLPYEQHVQAGLRQGIEWDEAVEMGERDDGPSSERERPERGEREDRPRRRRGR